jgi:superfamily II DNA/RNA helicase
MGITKPTPIQALAIEPVLKGKDVIAKAETGTGKTLAFGAPMMAKIDPARASVLGLVMSPTRELAEQVHQVLEKLGEARGVKTALIVGGEPLGPQVKKLQAGAQVVVGTPGRVLDLLNQKFLQFPWTEFAILDEADKMLEIGFIDDIKKILDACNEYRQTLLFSATFPPELLNLARGYTSDPAEIATASGVATVDTINQYVFRCSTDDNAKNIAHLIEDSAPEDVFLVFCERRTDVDQLMRKLERKRFSVKALHGGYDQAARFRVMTAFRTGDVKALVATDVASRGLDVAHVTHVVNLGLPREFSDYTHRIGRTGRAGRHGAAVTFISGRNERDFQSLLKHTGFDIAEIERPRDLYTQERKRAAERNGEVIDVEPKKREPKKRERKPRVRDDEGEAREERPRRERKPRRSREERAEREERPAREEREERSERSPRPERKPRRERARKDEPTRGESSRQESSREGADEAPARRPRRERRPRRDEVEEASAPETPEKESRPRRARGNRASRPDAREVEAAPPLDERPARRRRRRPAADEGVAGPFAEESPREESPARKPRRPRRSAEETQTDEAPARTRSRKRTEEAPADEAPERSRGGRRPRRSASGSEDDSPRPRRSRRDSEGESQRESAGKAKSARPKRERVGETTRADSKPKPSRPTPGGGFGAGV